MPAQGRNKKTARAGAAREIHAGGRRGVILHSHLFGRTDTMTVRGEEMFVVLLVTALSLDAFAASLAYAAGRVKIPMRSMLVISLVCTAVLAASVGLGCVIRPFVAPGAARLIGFGLLLGIGVAKSFESFLKRAVAQSRNRENHFRLRLFDIHFVLTVYADNIRADADESKVLSAKEALYLAYALSIDGLAAGFGCGLYDIQYGRLVVLSFALSLLAVRLGAGFGGLLAKASGQDFSWLGGAILILLAFSKLF
jgi:putative sporulation protein YtaF